MMEFNSINIFFIFFFLGSVSFFYFNALRFFLSLKLAKPINRTDHFWQRLWVTVKIAFGQTRILHDKNAGWLHASIFWGFLVFLISASEAVIQGFVPEFSWNFLGIIYSVITFSTDLAAIAIIAAVLYALWRRFAQKVKRLQGDTSEKIDAILVLGFILIIVCSLLLQNVAHSQFQSPVDYAIHPVSVLISSLISFESPRTFYYIFWFLHIGTILIFINYLFYSKHFHVYTSIFNVFFGSENIPNKLEPINFEDETIEKYGATEVTDLTWKSLLDGYSCTHCGRCTSVCPANLTGKILDPRRVIVEIRKRTEELTPILIKQNASSNSNGEELSPEEEAILNRKFVGDYESIEALWECTTCGACMEECPITIEHVPAIVEMRRSLVLMESNFPQQLQPTFDNMENAGNPWGFPQAERADWAKDLDVKIAAENPDFEYLYWVGCPGSYDDNAKKTTRAFAQILKAAKIDFAILGNEEKCNGDIARRSGNEYLANSLINENADTLKKYNVQKIITTCPHCFNIFKNEYPDYGISCEVIHHTQLIDQLIKENKIAFSDTNSEKTTIAYHDSCYLGRYNQIYEAPRNILQSIKNVELIEAERNRENGLCCGAGGGQMFMEEISGKRVNIERTEELTQSKPSCVALNCPFCNTMISDGVKSLEIEETQVKDIAQIVFENMNYEKYPEIDFKF
ncbi:MAG: (Fe-S)-binding protein [Chloroherpetonaceae bacterium]